MNKARRKEIERIFNILSECMTDLDAVRDEEEEALYNLPESLQESTKGDEMQENIDDLDNIVSDLSDVIEELEKYIQ